ncbi:hypothetical protein PHMEG_00030300 [Phytophthora megakarya]|uniref:Bzip transcription factor n=1 Tax=Phytophthora megakarya TaxID=4795 RepID=A0A225V356_9STRA|nr:hypothetical protein PHMEG_00030300 [Phytophthora megakarya]
MDACILRAPNAQQFNNTVISGVVQRSRRPNQPPHWSPQTGETRTPSPTFKTERCQPPPHGRYPPYAVGEKRTWQQSKTSDSTTSVTSFIQPTTHRQPSSQTAVVELILAEKKRIRELRRQRQIRYRKKKDDYANTLEEETHHLRAEIKKFEQRRHSVANAIPAKESIWSVATEYFRLFRFGYYASSASGNAQEDFVRANMAADAVFNGENGPQAILNNWKFISQWFDDVEFELEGLNKGGFNTLVATTTTSVTITERTLQYAFRCDTVDESTLVLQGQRIVMHGLTRFSWDPASNCVSSVIAQSDMLTPILQLLGSLEDVSCMFENALVSPAFQFKSM